MAGVNGHRRQHSGDGPTIPVAVATLSPQLIDGRLLQGGDADPGPQGMKGATVAVRRGSLAVHGAGDPSTATLKGPIKTRPAQLGRAAAPDKPPLTPPRVSGISLAPAPFDADHHHGHGCHSAAAAAPAGAAAHGGKVGGRPSQTQLNIGGKAPPHPANISLSGAAGPSGAGGAGSGAGAGAGGAGSGGAAASAGGGAAPLIAEGRSIQRGTATGLQLDPRLVAFHEINGGGFDSDSVCSTPVLNVQQLTRHDGDGAFGPLTPHPLSPSILTLCAQPGLDDQFEFGGVARATGELVDMRLCDSPRLPSS